MSAMNFLGVRAELCINGYAVLPRFFDENELDQLRYVSFKYATCFD